jgi:hypothetical protein
MRATQKTDYYNYISEKNVEEVRGVAVVFSFAPQAGDYGVPNAVNCGM